MLFDQLVVLIVLLLLSGLFSSAIAFSSSDIAVFVSLFASTFSFSAPEQDGKNKTTKKNSAIIFQFFIIFRCHFDR